MFVRTAGRNPRSRFRVSPAIFGAAAVLVTAMVAMAQVRSTTGPAVGQAVGAAPASAPADAKAAQKNPSLWDLHEKGGYVMYTLDAASILAVAIILERLFSLRRGRVLPSGFLPGLKAVWRDRNADRQAALQYAQADDSPMARMVAAYLKRLPRGRAQAEKALEDTGANEAVRLRTNLRIFYAIGSVATLLGLIGTIAGMIRAFMATAKAGADENKVELLSTGIYEAMVCTFGGLAVAIVVTAFYYYFVGRVEKLVTEMNDEVARFGDEFGGASVEADVVPVAGPASLPGSPALA